MSRTVRASTTQTRDKLIRAAEEIFARDGVDGGQMRDIVRSAGQSNPSAVQYHFGSRRGLLDAVMALHHERTDSVLTGLVKTSRGSAVEPAVEGVEGLDGQEAVRALVLAQAEELGTERGRRRLCVAAQLSHESGIRSRVPHPELRGSVHWDVIQRMDDVLPDGLAEPLRRERLDLALTLISAALADRARRSLAGVEHLTGDQIFLAELVSMTTALLRATPPAA
ncbi:TetR family transcriptional regulator [Streptomyces muensis]|uniref:TetR family transcriptional regulator n=2 Tax=Streptomyces muensis TaxID=1077944 RepID=A0A9X1PTP1_STRM4|nr:TetR family transcriptional regulator [Streptomyces muensis]MCF1592354.1 TetR family transcriptional regulator [Streptomyces muensis]